MAKKAFTPDQALVLKDAPTNAIVAWTLSGSLGLEFVIEMLRRPAYPRPN